MTRKTLSVTLPGENKIHVCGYNFDPDDMLDDMVAATSETEATPVIEARAIIGEQELEIRKLKKKR